ncbi:WD40-repeat-containing domain protein [Gongronella butleri]|nr:WD40-repeat-containing domain protein [Gongronella butleri]
MQIHKLATKELSFTPYHVQWVPSSTRVCVVGATDRQTSKLAVYSLNDKQVVLSTETETPSPIRCATFGAADTHTRHLATGDFAGNVQLWDTQRLDECVDSVRAHDTIIHCMDGAAGNGPSEIVTGSRDTTVKVWDTRQLSSAVFSVASNDEHVKSEVWAVAFGTHTTHRIIAIGYDNGYVRLFDLDAGAYLWETKLPDGVCSLAFDKTTTLTASTLAGAYVIQLNNGKYVELGVPSDTTHWSVRRVPEFDQYVSVTSGDGNMSVWDHQHPKKAAAKVNFTHHPIISQDWHTNKKGLFAVTAFDQTLRIGMLMQ